MLPTLTLILPCSPSGRRLHANSPLAGRPLLTWSIERARQARSVDRLFVVTADHHLAELAWEAGVETMAPGASSGSQSSDIESIGLELLETLSNAEGLHPEFVIFLDPAFPLRTADDIDASIALLRQRNADAVFSATPLPGLVWCRREGEWTSVDHDYHDLTRYDSPSGSVLENGAIYAARPRILKRTKNRLCGRIVAYRMPADRSFRIDSREDLIIAERLLSFSDSSSESSSAES